MALPGKTSGTLIAHCGPGTMHHGESREELVAQLDAALAKVRELDARVAANLVREHRMTARLAAAERLNTRAILATLGARHLESSARYALLNLSYASERLEQDQAPAELRDALVATLAEAATSLERARQLHFELSSRSPPGVSNDLRRLLFTCMKLARAIVDHDATVVPVLDDVPPVVGSDTLLTAIFVNLLVNAAEAVLEEHERPRIIRVLAQDGADGWVRVEIADSGPGIPRERIDRVFEPFYSTKQGPAAEGLGLTVCREAVALLGGHLDVDSTPGVGTKAIVRLPRATGMNESVPVSGRQPSGFSPTTPPVRKLSRP